MQYNNINNFIKNKRLKLGTSLNKFAIAAGIEPAILSRIENNKQGIKLDVLIKIATNFGQTPAEFLTEFEKSINK